MFGQKTGKPISRRSVLKILSSGVVYVSFAQPINCIFNTELFAASSSSRKFKLPNLKSLLVEGAFSIAFEALLRAGEYILDFLDIECPSCKHIFRKIGLALDVGTSLVCPSCSVPTRLAKVGINLLINNLTAYGFEKGLGLLSGGEMEVHKVAPAEVQSTVMTSRTLKLSVVETAICRDVIHRVPVDVYGANVPANPAELGYYTDVRGVFAPTYIYHVYYRNGEEVDRIRLNLRATVSGRYRTYSHKHHQLTPGYWVVVAETPRGDILSSDYFTIPGERQHRHHHDH